MKVNITPAQLEAIKNLTDDISSMVGVGDNSEWTRNVRLIDRFLKKNGQKRNFK